MQTNKKKCFVHVVMKNYKWNTKKYILTDTGTVSLKKRSVIDFFVQKYMAYQAAIKLLDIIK